MYIVRRAQVTDAQGIHEAHMRSIREVCSRDHSTEEIKGWGNRPFREEQRIQAITKQLVWVVELQGKIEGYGHLLIKKETDLTSAHIMGLYLTPEVMGKGLGAAIVEKMIAEAKIRGAREINLESTLTAHSFYKKIGFVDSGELSFIEIGGAQVRYIPMKLVL